MDFTPTPEQIERGLQVKNTQVRSEWEKKLVMMQTEMVEDAQDVDSMICSM